MSNILDEKGVDRILLTLLTFGKINQSKLEEKSGLSNYKILLLVPRLLDHDLISEDRGQYNQRIIQLTPKGEKVAKALKAARDAMNN